MKKLVTLALAIAVVLPAAAELKNDVLTRDLVIQDQVGPMNSGATYKISSMGEYGYGTGFWFDYDMSYITAIESPGEIKSVSNTVVESSSEMPTLYVSNEPMTSLSEVKNGTVAGVLVANGTLEVSGEYRYAAICFPTYTVDSYTKDFTSITFTWEDSPQVGVEGIEAENGKAEYYNLQGVRVENPENGMFIRVQNGKSTKVAIK